MLGQHWQIAHAADPKQLKWINFKFWKYVFGTYYPINCMTTAGHDQQFIILIASVSPSSSATQGDDGPHSRLTYKSLFVSSSLKLFIRVYWR